MSTQSVFLEILARPVRVDQFCFDFIRSRGAYSRSSKVFTTNTNDVIVILAQTELCRAD